MLKAELAKEREDLPLRGEPGNSSISRPGKEEVEAAAQENLPEERVYWRKLLLRQSAVRPEPKVLEAEEKPDAQKLPDTEAPASKNALPSTSSLEPISRSDA